MTVKIDEPTPAKDKERNDMHELTKLITKEWDFPIPDSSPTESMDAFIIASIIEDMDKTISKYMDTLKERWKEVCFNELIGECITGTLDNQVIANHLYKKMKKYVEERTPSFEETQRMNPPKTKDGKAEPGISEEWCPHCFGTGKRPITLDELIKK